MTQIQLSYLALSSVHVATQRAESSWPFYVVRAAGFTAAGLLVLLMLSGIGQVTGVTYRFIAPIKAWAVHKALALALCVAIVIHVGFLLVDHYIKFSFSQLFIPFLSHYNNKTQLFGLSLGFAAVALGILSMYGVAIIVASSLGWIDQKKGTWRKLHYLSYVVAVFVFLHALYAGSDLEYGLFRAVWILIGIIVFVGIVMRLRRSGALKRK
jgi:sulfoxide reductase heme-binding subunit YedZ